MSIIASMAQQEINDRIAFNNNRHTHFRAAAIITVITFPVAVMVSLTLIVLHFIQGGEFLDVSLLVKAVAPIIAGILSSVIAFGIMALGPNK